MSEEKDTSAPAAEPVGADAVVPDLPSDEPPPPPGHDPQFGRPGRPLRRDSPFMVGFFGALGVFVALLASWTHAAWRLWRATAAPLWVRQTGLLFLAFVSAYLTNGMFQDVSIIPMINMLLFFLAGAVMALTPWLTGTPRSASVDASLAAVCASCRSTSTI